MQAEEAVEIEDLILRDGDGGAHGVVVGLAPGNDDVEAVGGAALKDDDELLALPVASVVAAMTARVRKAGRAVVPARASAPLRRKMRREVFMG